jgi:hypothetical protein
MPFFPGKIVHESARKSNLLQNFPKQSTLVGGRFSGAEFFNTIGRSLVVQIAAGSATFANQAFMI